MFCDYVVNEVKRLYHMFPEKPMKPLTSEQRRKFSKVTKCHICLKEFQELNPKVQRSLSLHWPISRTCAKELQFEI